MKTFIERLMPMTEPYLLEKDGTFYQPRRTRYPGTVLLSVCGFPDVAQFEPLSVNFKNITQPLPEPELIGQLANIMWKTCVDEGITPQEFWERRLIPRPDSIETFLSIMQYGFNPAGAAGANAVLQFDFTGENPGTCQIQVKDGTMETATGDYEVLLKLEDWFGR